MSLSEKQESKIFGIMLPMTIMKNVVSLWNRCASLRFLIVGVWNFVFGYGVFAGLYWALQDVWHDWAIATLAAILGITMSFLTHRFITYRSNGCWWREYIRFYVVYGGQSALNVLLIWLLVTRMGYNAYFVQFMISIVLTIASYWAHKLYSFRKVDCR